MNYLFLFHTTRSTFCGGVFSEREIAEKWIAKYSLSGVLTKYPVDVGVYDWAIENGKFTPKKEGQFMPDFIGGFSTAGQEHYHYADGKCLD
jgi:hypothetical protein